MRIGIILTGYGMVDYVESCLRAWLAARTVRLDDHEFVICAVSVPFAAFPDSADDGTVARLRTHLEAGEIDHLITEPTGILETEARGAALSWLKERDVDVVIQVDLDEVMTERDISRIFRYVESQPYVGWFRLSLINLVFNKQTRLSDPFTPPRIHRIRFAGHEATHFSADNDIAYGSRAQSALASLTIPEAVAAPLHYSWLSDDELARVRSRKKVAYQMARWGDACSFRWDDDKGLIFDPAKVPPRTRPI